MVKREHLKGQNVMECIIIIMIEDDPFHISKIQAHTTGNNLFIKKKKTFFRFKKFNNNTTRKHGCRPRPQK